MPKAETAWKINRSNVCGADFGGCVFFALRFFLPQTLKCLNEHKKVSKPVYKISHSLLHNKGHLVHRDICTTLCKWLQYSSSQNKTSSATHSNTGPTFWLFWPNKHWHQRNLNSLLLKTAQFEQNCKNKKKLFWSPYYRKTAQFENCFWKELAEKMDSNYVSGNQSTHTLSRALPAPKISISSTLAIYTHKLPTTKPHIGRHAKNNNNKQL